MKVTPKFLQGGGFNSFFTTYVPVKTLAPKQTSVEGSGSRRSDDEEKGLLTLKDFFSMLKEVDGLPNEMMELVNNLTDTFKLSRLTGVDASDLTTTYLLNLYKVKIYSLNKAKYDKAVEAAATNGSWAEPAISVDGELVVLDEDGKMDTVDLNTYFKNRDRYSVLSVSNVAYYRQYSPDFINNQSAFDIISNSMGFEAFLKILTQAKLTIGTSDITRNGYFSAEGDASKGLELLKQLLEDDRVQALGSVTAEGLYEYKIIDKSQLQQIKALTSYMSAVFPDRAKTWAAYKMGTSDKEKATESLILQYLISGNTETHSFDINYKGSMDHVTGKDKTGKSSSESLAYHPEMTYLTAIQMGYGGSPEERTLNFGGNMSFTVTGTYYGGFLDLDQKTISNLTLEQLLNQTGIAGITNLGSITFGDNYINPNNLSKVAILNNGAMSVMLPCIREGEGQVSPNFELLEGFEKALNDVREEIGQVSPNASTEELMRYRLQMMSKLTKKIQDNPDLHELLDITGEIDESKFAQFFVVDALASSANFTFNTETEHGVVPITDVSNKLIHETKDSGDLDYFEQVTGLDIDEYDGYGILDSLLGYDNVYKSKIFIPLKTDNRLPAMLFSGQKLKDSIAMGVESEMQRKLASRLASTNTELIFR